MAGVPAEGRSLGRRPADRRRKVAENVAHLIGWNLLDDHPSLAATTAQNVAENILERPATALPRLRHGLWLGNLLRRCLTATDRPAAAQHVPQDVTQPTAATIRTRLRDLLAGHGAARPHPLGERAEHHRCHDRQQLLENGGTDARSGRKLLRHLAAHLLVTEDLPENLIAGRLGALEAHGAIVVERPAIAAGQHLPEDLLQAFRRLRRPSHAGGNHRDQRVERRAGLLVIEAELSAYCRNVHRVLPWRAPAVRAGLFQMCRNHAGRMPEALA
jgi:hypothetical protein